MGAPFNYEPVGLAWTRQGIDAYFLQGIDTSSLRQVRCTASGVTRGPRVTRPLLGRLPAEARPDREETSQGEWGRAVERMSARSFEAKDVAFELLLHPATGVVLSRHWRALAEGAEVTVEPPDAPAFSLLAAVAVQPASGKPVPSLQPLPQRLWTVDSDGAFALLEKELPKGARISELDIQDHEIDVQIEWPTPAFGGNPPAPLGDKSFDEYGVADVSFWYPRTERGFGCAAGRPLAAVRAAFDEAKGQAGRLAWAWYSCSSAYSHGREGKWHIVPAGR